MKLIVNPEYTGTTREIASLPNRFSTEGDSIYKGRNEIKVFRIQNMEIAVKSFHTPRLLNRIIYTFFRPSKAKRSYEHGITLIRKGIGTPAPIAYIENKKGGLLNDSYFISSYREYTGMMRELRTGQLAGREELLRHFARFTAFVHDQEVLHKDYSPGNILYNKEENGYSFYLVDINRMQFGPVSLEEGCKNLRRLWGNDEMILFIAKEYALARNFDPELCSTLALQYHHAFWKRYSARHQGFQPYER